MARVLDGCRQVPDTACYLDNVFFIVMLQISAPNALSPSVLSKIKPENECPASGQKSERIPPYWVDFTIQINHAPSRELAIHSEVIMSCFNHSLTDSLTKSTHRWSRECLYEDLFPSKLSMEILIYFLTRPGFEHQLLESITH